MNKGILKILIKNFYIYFKKNWIQILTLILSFSFLLGLISGLENTNNLINKNLNLISNISENNTISFNNNPFISKESTKEQYNNWVYSYNGIHSNISYLNKSKKYKDEYNLNSLWYDSFNIKDKIIFNEKYFEIYKINQSIINNYNQHHKDKIIINKNKINSLYGLVLENKDKNGNNSFTSFYKNKNYDFINLKINKNTMDNQTLLFYDDLNYLNTKEITIPYKNNQNQNQKIKLMYDMGIISNDNNQYKVPVTLYYANKLYDDYYEKLYIDKKIPINIKNWNSINEDFKKAGYVDKFEKADIDQYVYNFYINNIKNLLYEATTFSCIFDTRRYEHFSTTNLDNEKSYLFIKYNNKLENNQGFSPIDQNILTGYKKDGKSFYNLKKGEVLVNPSFYYGNAFNNNSYLKFLNYNEKFKVLGRTIQSNILTRSLHSPDYKNNGAIWLNPDDYEKLKNKLKILPQTNIKNNLYLGNSMVRNPLNPNIKFGEQEQLVNSNKSYLGSFLDNPSSLVPKLWSNYKKYTSHNKFIYITILERINNIDLIIVIFIMLLAISALVTIFIIINKIIKNNSFIIGNLKANGLKISNIIFSISVPINIILSISILIAILLSYLTSQMITYTFKIGCNVLNYDFIFNIKNNVLIMLIPLLVMIIYSLILLFAKTKKNTLLILSKREKQEIKMNFLINFISKINKIKLLTFNTKISLKFAWNAKLKIFMCFIMTTVLSVMLYLSLSCSIIYAQINYTFDRLNFNYDYYLSKDNKVDFKSAKTTKNIAMNSQLNINDFADFNSTHLNNPENKIYHIQNLISPKDTLNIPNDLKEHYIQYGFKYTWIYAKELQELYNEATNNKTSTTFKQSIIKTLKITPNDLNNILLQYRNNEFIINDAVKNNAILSFGFQFYNKNDDNLMASSGLNLYKINNVNDLKKITTHKSHYIYVNSYTSKKEELYDLERVHLGKSPSEILTNFDKNFKQYIKNQNYYKIKNYLTEKVNKNKNDYFITAPLFMNIKENKVYFNNEVNTNWIADYKIHSGNKKFTLYILFNVVDKIKTISTQDNFTTNNVIQNILKYDVIKNLKNLKNNPFNNNYPNIISKIYSQYRDNYYKKYIGIYNISNKYFVKDYNKNTTWKTFLYGFLNSKNIKKYSTEDVQILFLIINLISILSLIICAIQIILTIELMIKENINNINLFKSMGYNRMWIFKKIFIVFIPVITLAIIISGPIAFTISNSFYKIFSKLIRFDLIPTISYLNVFWTLLILVFLYIFLYIIIEKMITSKTPITKFITE